jgi:hypothetical protein
MGRPRRIALGEWRISEWRMVDAAAPLAIRHSLSVPHGLALLVLGEEIGCADAPP